ncbi:MAG: GC-type dockerin domain-anchored protein [Phycisphaerales bacterium]
MITLWASSVPVVNGWNYESNAAGALGSGCTGQQACRNLAANPNRSASGPAGFGTTLLWAEIGDTSLGGEEITSVVVDAYGSWASSVSGQWVMRVQGPAGLDSSKTATTSGFCGWLHQSATGQSWNITNLLGRPWTEDDINALRVGIRRGSGTAPAENLYATAFRVQVTTNCPPVLFIQGPASTTACDGDDASFTVIAQGAGELIYQWRHNGIDIPGEEFDTLDLFGVGPADAGTYDCVVQGECGVPAVSPSATLVISTAAAIATQPSDFTCCRASCPTVQFSVAGSGSAPLQYRWYENGVLIPGANGPQLVRPIGLVEDGDEFYAEVCNGCGCDESFSAFAIIDEPAGIDAHPEDVQFCRNSTSPVQFEVIASGSEPINYQWKRNGVPLGTNSSVLALAPAVLQDGDQIRVTVSNGCGPSVTSDPAFVTIDAPPAITLSPGPQRPVPGDDVDLMVEAPGSELLEFQWLRNGVPIQDGFTACGAEYLGTDTEWLTIFNAQSCINGTFTVRVFNDCGSLVSAAASVVVCNANCDRSGPPALNVADFICFLNKFAAGDPYANCDASTTAPVLNVADFICFLNKYGTGCP